jgi:hypothetical protein
LELEGIKDSTKTMAAAVRESVAADYKLILDRVGARALEQEAHLREARVAAQLQTEALHLAQEELAAALHHTPQPATQPQPRSLSTADEGTDTAELERLVLLTTASMSPPLRTRASEVQMNATPSPMPTPSPPHPMWAEMGCSPSSPMGNRDVVEAQLRLKVAEQAAEVDKLLVRCRTDHKLIVEKERENDRLTMRYMVDLERIAQHENEMLKIMGLASNDLARVEHYKQRLTSAASALNSLQEVHAAEVKAVKHEAHVKDLVRVAKEREASIERDRLAIELKYIK